MIYRITQEAKLRTMAFSPTNYRVCHKLTELGGGVLWQFGKFQSYFHLEYENEGSYPLLYPCVLESKPLQAHPS